MGAFSPTRPGPPLTTGGGRPHHPPRADGARSIHPARAPIPHHRRHRASRTRTSAGRLPYPDRRPARPHPYRIPSGPARGRAGPAGPGHGHRHRRRAAVGRCRADRRGLRGRRPTRGSALRLHRGRMARRGHRRDRGVRVVARCGESAGTVRARAARTTLSPSGTTSTAGVASPTTSSPRTATRTGGRTTVSRSG